MGQFVMPSTQITSDFVVKRSENFDFLEDDFPELYQLALQVERYYLIDTSCCLLKLRLYVELWCRIVGNRFDLFSNTQEELHRQIQILSLSGRLPSYIIDLLSNIRLEANQGVHIHHKDNGEWGIGECLPLVRLKELLKDAFELTQYLAFTLNNKTIPPDIWVEPTQTASAEYVYGALNGDGKAAYRLAKQYAELLQDEDLKILKIDKASLQQDLAYWLKKARYLKYYKANYLYAYACVHRLLGVASKKQIRMALDVSLETDSKGNTAFLYYQYLMEQGEPTRAFDFLIEAAERGVAAALCLLMVHFVRNEDQEQLDYWVEKGMDAQLPWGYLLHCSRLLVRWNGNRQDPELISKTRGALLSIKNRQIPGWGFYEGWCQITGSLGRHEDPMEGLRLMRLHYAQLPHFFNEKERYFDALMAWCREDESCYEDILTLSVMILKQATSPEKEADRKYHIARLVMRALTLGMNIPCALNFRILMKEAATLGHTLAIQFLGSTEGKAWMRRHHFHRTRVNHKKVDRVKQKRAKKKARKASRVS